MGIFDTLIGKKDPEIRAIEERAYKEEREKVRKERKNEAARQAALRGKQRARETSGSRFVDVARKAGKGIMKAGEYGASLNWGGEVTPIQTPSKKGKGKKKRHTQSHETSSPFEMPEFPF